MSYVRFILEYQHPKEWGISIVAASGPYKDGRSPDPKKMAAVLRDVADQMDSWSENLGTAEVEFDGEIGDDCYLAMIDLEGAWHSLMETCRE